MIPQYGTKLFCEIWEDATSFLADYQAMNDGIPNTISTYKAKTLFYLLYARYGNSPIANYDETQFKFKVFGIIWQYGPTWEKKLEIQEKLRALDLNSGDLFVGTRAIFNSALNPNIAPSTSSTEELDYINTQNTTNYKKSKMDAYSQLLSLLEADVTKAFIDRFESLFKKFAEPART